MKRVEHLENGFLDVLLDRDARAERATALLCVKHDRHELPLRALPERTRNFAHHRDVENVQRRPRERDPRDAIFDSEIYMLVRSRHPCNLWLKTTSSPQHQASFGKLVSALVWGPLPARS